MQTYQVRTEGEAAALLRRLALPPNAEVLEAACGSGDLLRALAEAEGPRWLLTGIDGCVATLFDACIRASQERTGIVFMQADMEQLPYEDGTFDLVFTRRSLSEAAQQELKRVSKANVHVIYFHQQ